MASKQLWRWHGITGDGNAQDGMLWAESRALLLMALQQQMVTPLSLKRIAINSAQWRGDKSAEVIHQLATLLKAGLTLSEGLALLAEQHPSKQWQALLQSLAHDLEQGIGFAIGQGGGRLVHDQDAGVEEDRSCDRHRLALAAGECLHRLLETLEVRVEAAHHFAGLGLHRHVVERTPGGAQLAAEIEVGGGVDIVGDGERLVDRLDAVFLGVARIVDVGGLAVDQDLAAIALVGAGENLDKRRLAGAVVAEQGDDLAGIEIDRGIVHGMDAAEGDGDVLQLHEGRTVVRHWMGSSYLARAR